MDSLEEQIKAKAIELGFDACGFVGMGDLADHEAALAEREKCFPHSAVFYDRVKRMTNGAGRTGSVIVGLWRYDRFLIPEGLKKSIGKSHLVSGFNYAGANAAAFEEYLKELGLNPAANVSPARWAAVKAGLGRFRNNNFFYTDRGSWNAIFTWATDRILETDRPAKNHRYSCPEGCDRCIKACPTGALTAPMTMDPTRCVAFLTFYHGSPFSKRLRDRMGTWVYGCDACQNACPANANTWRESETLPEMEEISSMLDLQALLDMDEHTYQEKIQPTFNYINQDGLWQWKCNAIRAMANEDPVGYRAVIARALDDDDERVREMATWALEKLPLENNR